MTEINFNFKQNEYRLFISDNLAAVYKKNSKKAFHKIASMILVDNKIAWNCDSDYNYCYDNIINLSSFRKILDKYVELIVFS